MMERWQVKSEPLEGDQDTRATKNYSCQHQFEIALLIISADVHRLTAKTMA